MHDLLLTLYPWTKSLHVISMVAWMAGLFYLPRIFVYHVEQAGDDEHLDRVFGTMERRLLKAIMTPAMIATWFFGTVLVLTPGVVDILRDGWFHVKLAFVLLLTWFHFWLGARRREFAVGANRRSGRRYRLMNELPTLALVVIVVMVIVRPF